MLDQVCGNWLETGRHPTTTTVKLLYCINKLQGFCAVATRQARLHLRLHCLLDQYLALRPRAMIYRHVLSRELWSGDGCLRLVPMPQTKATKPCHGRLGSGRARPTRRAQGEAKIG